MPQLARTGARVSPITLHEQRTGLLKSPSSADRRNRSTKPENAVSVKFGSRMMPKRMRCFDVPSMNRRGCGSAEFMHTAGKERGESSIALVVGVESGHGIWPSNPAAEAHRATRHGNRAPASPVAFHAPVANASELFVNPPPRFADVRFDATI